ncbi:MAG: hypothetical protein ACJ75B_16125 [Flavisolibacter sp.]
MKQLYITLLAMACSLISFAQSKGSAKLYGFKESVSVGKAPSHSIDESGAQKNEVPRARHNLFIYLESSTSVVPTEMWIAGQKFSVRVDTVKKTPVERSNYSMPGRPKTVVLVPATKKTLLQLTPVSAKQEGQQDKLKKLITDNELLVLYKQKGKVYYSSLKTLTALAPVAMQ